MSKPREQKPCVKCGKTEYLHFTDDLCRDCHWEAVWIEERKGLEERLPKDNQAAREAWYEKYGLEGRWAELDFESFKREKQPKAFDFMKSCAIEFSSAVLYSPSIYGVGKTHLVSALANEIVDKKEAAFINDSSKSVTYKRCPVKFITETKLLSGIRQTYQKDSNENEDDIYKKLATFELLIIDDVGKVKPHDLSFLQGVYFRIIDDRYTNGQFIIITTNLDLKELEAFIGGASADRLREMCGTNFIKILGTSYRKTLKAAS